MESGLVRAMDELGAPIRAITARFVNGFMYTRTVPLVGASRTATKLPPLWLLRVVSRVHPTFRQRTRAATRALATPPGPAVVARWRDEIRPSVQARNRAFAAVDVAACDDAALAAHCRALLDHLHAMSDLHFWLHGYDLGPIARYVAFTSSLGIPTANAVAALAGASPSTSAPRRELAAIRAAVGDHRPQTLAELRASSPEAAARLDTYLAERGHTLVTGYDLDALTLAELPETLFDTIMRAEGGHGDAVEDADGAAPAIAALRARVPDARRAEFDARLAEARDVMDMRDDNGPTVFEQPAGLLRLALLEVGRRLVARGGAERPEHALELAHDEVAPLLRDRRGPGGDELAARARRRRADAALTPPETLGPVEPVPPAGVLPGPLAEFATVVQVALAELGMAGMDPGRDGLHGTGIGTEPYRGRVRRSASADEAFDAMEPGDVLVVRATSPAFNAVLSIAGAVVTADGGPMSHAAVLARELGIAAVVGAHGALDIPDGAMVEVDPVAGVVRVL
jgi:pyruvate,water dikinase